MDRFHTFLNSLERENNSATLESISQGYSILFESVAIEDARKKFQGTDEEFKAILQTDPSYDANKPVLSRNGQWLLKLHANGDLPSHDLYKAKDYLAVFDNKQYKKHFEIKELFHMKSLPEMYINIKKVFDAINEGREHEFLGKKANMAKGKKEVEIVYEDKKWLILIPKTLWASIAWGTNTQWCTATTNLTSNAFEGYNEDGDIYILINNENRKKYQFYFCSSIADNTEFKDVENSDVNPLKIGLPKNVMDMFNDKYPLAMVEYNDNAMEVIKNNPEKFVKEFEKNPHFITKFPKDKRMNILNEFSKSFSKGLTFAPNVISYFPLENRMKVLGMFDDAFDKGFRESPHLIRFFHLKNRLGLIKIFSESFAEGFKKDASLRFFPVANHMEIIEMFPTSFQEGFKKYPPSIKSLPKEHRAKVVIRFPNSFSEYFENHPDLIKYFPMEDRMSVLETIPLPFIKAARTEPTVEKYFPMHKRKDIFGKKMKNLKL